jgi:hypothetical protein
LRGLPLLLTCQVLLTSTNGFTGFITFLITHEEAFVFVFNLDGVDGVFCCCFSSNAGSLDSVTGPGRLDCGFGFLRACACLDHCGYQVALRIQ